MKRWQPACVSLLVLVVTAVLTLSGCSQFGSSPEDTGAEEQAIADKEQELAELKEQVAEMEKELAQSRQIAEMKQQVAEMEQKLVESREQASRPAPSSPAPPSAPQSPATPPRQQAAAPPPPPEIRSITLPDGTPIVVRTTTEISTKVANTGDPFEASLEEPLMDGATLIAPKGARVMGVVAHSDKGGRVKGRAQLEVRLQSLVAEDGQVIDVQTSTVGMSAKKSTKKDALKVGIASGVGAAIGAIAGGGKGAAIGAGAGAGAGAGTVLLTRGEAAVLPAESVLDFELAAPVTITEKQYLHQTLPH